MLKNMRVWILKVIIIENTFEFIMQGLGEKYNQEIVNFIHHFNNGKRPLSVAQLSMVEAAERYELQTGTIILNPLRSLVDTIIDQLKLSSLI